MFVTLRRKKNRLVIFLEQAIQVQISSHLKVLEAKIISRNQAFGDADDIGHPTKGGHWRRARASENSVLTSEQRDGSTITKGIDREEEGLWKCTPVKAATRPARELQQIRRELGLSSIEASGGTRGSTITHSSVLKARFLSLRDQLTQEFRSHLLHIRICVHYRRWPLTNYMEKVQMDITIGMLETMVDEGNPQGAACVTISKEKKEDRASYLQLKVRSKTSREDEDDSNGEENEVDIMRSLGREQTLRQRGVISLEGKGREQPLRQKGVISLEGKGSEQPLRKKGVISFEGKGSEQPLRQMA
ncbi:hypothetical protein LXL04_039939 [Taraxacum kok-saghyz]